MNKPKVYIAGKISGDPNYKEKFERAQKALEAEGYIVLNPATLPAGMEAADYMKICFTMIDVADVVAFISDFAESCGAMLELEYCRYINKQAFMIQKG